MLSQKVLIGIDGGGTHSTAVAAWPDGRIAAVTEGGGLNFHNSGVETVHRRLEEMVQDLCARCGAEAEEICVGMSALDAPADAATLALFTRGMFRPGQLDLQSDAYIALQGFALGKPGVIVIAGTGSMLLMQDGAGCQHAAGGWGYLLGDAGSGYTLAREGLLAAIDASEGLAPATPLEALACQYFSTPTLRQTIDRVYAPDFTPDRLAGFARHVLAEAKNGDGAARAILERNMERLARQAAHLLNKEPTARRVGLYGGIFAHSDEARAAFTKTLKALAPQAEVSFLSAPPEIGAVIHLMQKEGSLSEEILHNLTYSYEEMKR